MKTNYSILLFSTFLILLLPATSGAQQLLNDNFDNNNLKWEERENANEKIFVDNKRSLYHLEQYNGSTNEAMTTWIDLSLTENKNFKITAMFYKEKGVKDYGYGLIWGGKTDNFYSYLVSGGGYYCVGKVVNGVWQDITPNGWYFSEAVSQGNHAYNKLTLSKVGDTYHFEVNDLKVATIKCGAFFGNKIGFNVNNKQRIMVDWIKVEYI